MSKFYSDRNVDFVPHNEVTPAVNQIETHPFHEQTEAQKILQERDVRMEAWWPLQREEQYVPERSPTIYRKQASKQAREKYRAGRVALAHSARRRGHP